MTLIDDATRYTHIYFLKKESEAVKYLKEFCELAFNPTGKYPRVIRSDRGGEYVNKEWTDYCSSEGIEHQLTPAYSPQSNGVTERFNLTIANMSRTALLLAPQFLWSEAFNWSTYLRNRLPIQHSRSSVSVWGI